MNNILRILIFIKKFPKHAIFPAIVGVIALILSILSISGTSIGTYHYLFSDGEDPNMLSGTFKSIRADEWLVISTKTIAQERNDYNAFNPNIGSGEDLSIRPSVPTNDWSAIFRPENLAFLIAPLEQAFAFKWWFMLALVLIAAYYFSLTFFTKSIPASILFALFIGFAPMLQWTYRAFILLPIAYGLLLVLVAYKMTKDTKLLEEKVTLKNNYRRVIKYCFMTLALSYLIIAFALVLYPPFQIIAALVLGAFYIDRIYALARAQGKRVGQLFQSQLVLIPALVLGVSMLGIFFVTHKEAVLAIKNTEHPGIRSFETGAFDSFDIFRNLWVSGTTPQILERRDYLAITSYFEETGTGNSSDASGFMWILPILLTLLIFARRRLKKPLPYVMLGVSALVLFVLFVPGVTIPILEQVPGARWSLAVGLLTFLIFGLLYEDLRALKGRTYLTKGDLVIFALTGVFIGVGLMLLFSLFSEFPLLFSKLDMLLAVIITIVVPLALVLRHPLIALAIMALFTMAATFNVNPFYKGLSAATDSKLVQTIERIDENDSGTWLMAANRVELELIPAIADVKSITAHYSYPQDFWRIFDPENEKSEVYNRVAHVKAGLTTGETELYPVSHNTIGLRFNSCDVEKVKALNIQYYVVEGEVANPEELCIKRIDKVEGGGVVGRLSIYESTILD